MGQRRVRARSRKVDEKKITTQVGEMLEIVRLGELAKRKPTQLSGVSNSALRWPGRSSTSRARSCSTSPSARST